jgi:hypothetical protein
MSGRAKLGKNALRNDFQSVQQEFEGGGVSGHA